MKLKNSKDFLRFIEKHTWIGEEVSPKWRKDGQGGKIVGNEVSYVPCSFETYTFEVNKFFGEVQSIRLVKSETREEILHIHSGEDFTVKHISDKRLFMQFKKDVTSWLYLYDCLPD